MSIQAVSAVLDHSESEKSARLVAISIANHVDKYGVGWLSVRLAMEESRIRSRTTVSDAIRSLRDDLGELVVLVKADGETHRPPLYWLNLPGLSGDCGDDHPYFLAYGRRQEIVSYPGTEIDPGPHTDSEPPPGSRIDPTPGQNLDTVSIGNRPKAKNNNPDDGAPPPGTLSNLLADLVADNDPDGKRPTVTKAWLNAERLMLGRDERDYDVAERLIRWTLADDFWKSNVQSMPKFRHQYGRLFLRASQQSVARRKTGSSAGEHPADRRIRELGEQGEDDVIESSAEEESS
jgi:hypothetical protein